MNQPLVVKGLQKSYGEIRAVDGLDFEVNKGEVFGLLGHNGAGKTTTIECILGVIRNDAGSIELLGMNPSTNRKKIFERVGVQFQQTNYHDKIRVSEICEVTEALYKSPANWKKLMQTFGLTGMESRVVSELSGGERQRLSVLLALIPNPEVVFLDELTTGLDTHARRSVWKYLEQLKSDGLTILLTSHYMDEVKVLCDRACILKKGKVLVMGSIEELIEKSPYNNLEEAYLWYTGEEDAEDESI